MELKKQDTLIPDLKRLVDSILVPRLYDNYNVLGLANCSRTVNQLERIVDTPTSLLAHRRCFERGVDNIVRIVGTIFQELVGINIQYVVYALLNKITCECCGIAKHHKWHLCLDIDITVEASSKGI